MPGKPHLHVTTAETPPVFNLVVRVSKNGSRFHSTIANLDSVSGEGPSLRDAIASVTDKAKKMIRDAYAADPSFQTLATYPEKAATEQQFLVPIHL